MVLSGQFSQHLKEERDRSSIATASLVVVPTTLIQLTRDEARSLHRLLDTPGRLNTCVEQLYLQRSSAEWFWFDLQQLQREALDFLCDLKTTACCLISSGCRIQTTSPFWLKFLELQVFSGTYAGEGTSWVPLHYAVVAAQATEVKNMLLEGEEVLTPTLFWQREFAPMSLRALPPISPWN